VKKFTPVFNKKISNYIPAMLVKETDTPFNDKDWIFEIKWDGYRAIAELNKSDVKLYSRNGNQFNKAYPEISEALAKLNLQAVIDGEIIVMDESGKPNFQLLQHYAEDRSFPIFYYVFDLLKLADESLLHLPLLERKRRLRKLLKENDIIKYSDHIEKQGKAMFTLIGKQQMEGIIAKKSDSPYLPGKRSANWLKIKHHKSLDAIICGFTRPAGTRKYFGALVLGIKQGQNLHYIGHTGSGFTDALLKEIAEQLQPLITSESPFVEPVDTNAPVTWVRPVLVCEVKYGEKTRDGKLRHPIFLRLRDDKTSEDTTMLNTKTQTKNHAQSEQKKIKKNENLVTDGRHKVPVSHWDKIFWPEEKITKGDVVNYYQSIADIILPYLKNRPESLKRNPGGITDKGFFHKDAGENVPAFVQTFQVHSDSADKTIDYIVCNNKATLAYLNNLGCIELNPWHSTTQALENPDYVIIDIDPSEKNTFEQVIEAANVVHDILEQAGAANFCKTSGATGLHIYIPTSKKYSYDQIKDFAELICTLTNEQLPQTTSMERSLSKRGSKIYMDHLQNRYGQTIAAAYSLRPYSGATVSTPLKWEEVKPGLNPCQFTINNTAERVFKTGDLFKGILGKGINMKACLKKLE
jgi:bifunctional non-homologous end joining protein LigD